MTVLSRALLRKLIIQEMRKPPLSSGLTFDDDTFEIDRDTEIEEFPEVEYGDFGDYDDYDEDDENYEMRMRNMHGMGEPPLVGSDLDDEDSDTDEESDTEDREGSYPDYAVFGPDNETAGQIKRRVHGIADDLEDRIKSGKDDRSARERANKRYEELMKQVQQGNDSTGVVDLGDLPPDPEFMDTEDLRENIRRKIKQSINRKLLIM